MSNNLKKNKETVKKNQKEEFMNLKLISKNKFKKSLFVLGGLILATNLTYSAAVTETVGVEFTIHDSLIINTTTTNLDFGTVDIKPGPVTAPAGAEAVLTISGTTASTVIITAPKNVSLAQADGSSIPFTSTLSGTGGTASESGTNVTWTSTGNMSDGDAILNFGGSIALAGTETPGDYSQTATINVAYN